MGAGGLSNAFPELVSDAGRGGKFELRNVPSDEPGMSPLEIWCNESQERYVLSVAAENLDTFAAICERERAPFAVVGEAVAEQHLSLSDEHFDNKPIDLPLEVLLGKPPKMSRDVVSQKAQSAALDEASIDLAQAVKRVLTLPTVADKSFLITIGDRTVTGLVNRDQMVGPWQVPVADCAVTAASFDSYVGEAMSMGERTPLALLDFGASARMAVAESLLNMAGADIGSLKRIKLSANWMSAAGHPGEDAGLYEAVKAVGEELCPELELTIPVGKDSMSMKTAWEDKGEQKAVTAPMSLIISAFGAVRDIRNTVTPELRTDKGETVLLLADLAKGKTRLGGSCLAQVFGELGDIAPDLDQAAVLKGFFEVTQQLVAERSLLAYHDKSDGGLFTTLVEMAFAGHTGLNVDISALAGSALARLFNEELGAVLQVSKDQAAEIIKAYTDAGVDCHPIAELSDDGRIRIQDQCAEIYSASRTELRKLWSETTYRMQALRDNPECAREEFDLKLDETDPGLTVNLSFDPAEDVAAPYILKGAAPKMAILREQGVNSHIEMAAAFERAGFESRDVHMSDILSGRISWKSFRGWWPVVASLTVMYWAPVKVGPSPSCSTAVPVRTSAASSSVPTALLWVFVTVARCSPTSRRSFRVPSIGRTLSVTALNALKRVLAWWKCSKAHRCSSAVWPAPECRLPFPTGKGVPSLLQLPPWRLPSRAALWRCVMSMVKVRWPACIHRTPTARPTACPGSVAWMAKSPS